MAGIPVGVPEGNLADCPYKGLVPYAEADRDFFFGRERDREIIVANLVASKLTLLYGASGVGKSSVLRAGVIPDLRELSRSSVEAGRGPEYVPVILDAWSGDPRIEARDRIAEAIAALGVTVADPPGELPFAAAVRAWARAVDASLLIMLDQFEEFLLYHATDKGHGGPVSEIAAALSEPESPANFLISIREDAVANLDEFKGRIPRLFENYLRLRRLDARSALDAIERPIEAFNSGRAPPDRFSIEPALAGSVIKQVAAGAYDAPGIETPFLQLVMTTLWDAELESGSRRLRLQTLERLGGAAQIVSSHLDRRMAGLSAAERGICATVFNQLVTPSGTKVAHRLTDLAAYSGVPPRDLEPVLSKLADPGWRILRVLSDDGPQRDLRYEIFHDVLAAAVLDWRAQYQAHSAAAEIVARERRRVRQRRARLLRMLLVGALAGLAIASIVVAVLARSRAAENERRESVSASQALALASGRELGHDPMRALKLAAGATREESTGEAVTALRAALAGARYRRMRVGSGALEEVDVASGGDFAFVVTGDGARELWRLGDPPALVTRFGRTRGGITLVGRFSPDGRAIATVETGGIARLLLGGATPRALSLPCIRREAPSLESSDPGGSLVTAAVPPVWIGSRRLVTACTDRVIVWSVDETADVTRLPHSSTVTATAASADGRRLAIGGADGRLALWDLSGERRIRVFRQPGSVATVFLDRRGDLGVATTARRDVRLFRLGRGGAKTSRLAGVRPADVAVITVSPDGRWVAAGGQDGRVRVWDTDTGVLNTLTGHTGGITSIAFSPASDMVLTASSDRTARVWDVDTGAALGLFPGPTDGIRRAVFGTGDMSGSLVTASADGVVSIWPIESESTGTLASDASSASFVSRAGHVLVVRRDGATDLRRRGARDRTSVAGAGTRWRDAAVSSDLRSAVLVPARGAAEPLAIAGMPDGYALSLEAPSIKAAAFAPDGKTLVTAGGDAKVRRWRTDEWVETVGIDANGGLSDVLVTDDGKHVVAVGVGGTTIWDMQSGSELAAREGAATVVAANHNASRVVSVGAGAASVWEPAHDRLRDLVVPGDTVRTAAITTDGGVVATGGQSGTIWLWDAVTGNRLDWLRLGRAPIRTLDFSFDNTSLVATTTTGVVRVLGCEICQPPERLIALARRRIGG